MPANLPAEAKNKWKEVSQTRDLGRKLELLREFLSLVPKHKGTAKLCAQVRKQMATIRREIEKKRRRKSGGASKFFIEKEGAAQVVISGETNVGRSSFLRALTNAQVEISDVPFKTTKPVPGILNFEDISFQLVESPPLFKGASKGKGFGPQTLGLIRNADGLILMVDLSSDPLEQLKTLIEELEEARIRVEKAEFNIEIDRSYHEGLKVKLNGTLLDCTVNDVIKILYEYNIHYGILRIDGKATLDDVEEAIISDFMYTPTLVVANKLDCHAASKNYLRLKEALKGRLESVPVSCKSGEGLEDIGRRLFEIFGLVRVYCKEPNQKAPSPIPFVLRGGATIYDLAKNIHSEFVERFFYAKVWSKRLRFSPQRVGLNFELKDGDVVEIRLK